MDPLRGWPDRPLVATGRSTTSRRQLLRAAAVLARSLPEGPAALNLCECRENFLVGFVALLARGHTGLLAPSRAPDVIEEVAREHPGCYRLDDAMVARSRAQAGEDRLDWPDVPHGRVVVIGYTSGSTGRPRPNPKTWGSFLASTRLNAQRLESVLGDERADLQPWILATVPSQHMYGVEMAVLLPLLAGLGIHGGHPFYPADIAAALRELPQPRVLVTTPVHLRALLQSGIELPALDAVVSATAPLARETAQAVEQRFGTRLLEFFGSTETCVIASRRAAREDAWTVYPGVELQPQESGTAVVAPWFPAAVPLQDVLEPCGGGRFVVRGRNSDMVEVGGKRASLGDLTRRLLSVPGVSDAVVFQPEAAGDAPVQRLAALAVADGLSEAELLARLAPMMDPVFLPRPLVIVAHLPRNEVGKLPRDQLLAALRR